MAMLSTDATLRIDMPVFAAVSSTDDVLTVYVIERVPQIAATIAQLSTAMHFTLHSTTSTQQFLSHYDGRRRGCIVLSSFGGPFTCCDDQAMLVAHRVRLPILIATNHADIGAAILSFRQGVVDYLLNPSQVELQAGLRRALTLDQRERRQQVREEQLGQRMAALKPGEREVLELVMAGQPNKNIATSLGISIRTVEDRRAKIMRKFDVDSLPSLLRVVMCLAD